MSDKPLPPKAPSDAPVPKTLPYPFDTRHADATAGILPLETRQLLIDAGWVHESEVSAISNTKLVSRRRWAVPSAMIGNEIYYRLADILGRLDAAYAENEKKLEAKHEEAVKASKAIA